MGLSNTNYTHRYAFGDGFIQASKLVKSANKLTLKTHATHSGIVFTLP